MFGVFAPFVGRIASLEKAEVVFPIKFLGLEQRKTRIKEHVEFIHSHTKKSGKEKMPGFVGDDKQK